MTRLSSRENKPLTTRVRAKNQITLPQAVCEAAGLTEGEFLALTVTSKRTVVGPGSIVLSPRQLTERPWTAEDWERAEAEVDAEIKAGKLSRRYKGAKAAIRALRRK